MAKPKSPPPTQAAAIPDTGTVAQQAAPAADRRLKLGEPVIITAINNVPGTIEAIHDRVGQETQYSVAYINGTGTRIEDWLRADQFRRAR